MFDSEANLQAAERVAGLLERHGVPAVVIGAVALAAYRYVRHTEDIVELLRRNPEVDLAPIRKACRRYLLRGLDAILRELHS
jgi:hypothetical protein